MYEITGILKLKRDEQKVSDTFKKREFVLTDNNSSNYPQHILFQLTNDRCSRIDEFNPGDEMKVSFFIRGREWQSKEGQIRYFTSLDAWKVEHTGEKATQTGGGVSKTESAPADNLAIEEQDDLPF